MSRTDGLCLPFPWFVVNPNAGDVRYDRLAEAIRGRLAGRKATISCEPPAPGEPRMVVAVGGDGTVNRVINHCDLRSLRLGIIPRGSANDLGAELAIPSDFHRAWSVLEAGRFASIDLISVNGACFATCGGIGLATDVAARANGWKARMGWPGRLARRFGPLVYVLAALAETARSGRRSFEATIRVDGTTRRVPLSALLVSNQARFGRWFSASPQASNRDGQLQLCGVEAPRSRRRLLWICAQLLRGRPERCPEVFQLQAGSVTVETANDAAFFGDGEVIARGRHFAIEVLPRALRVATARRDLGFGEAS